MPDLLAGLFYLAAGLTLVANTSGGVASVLSGALAAWGGVLSVVGALGAWPWLA